MEDLAYFRKLSVLGEEMGMSIQVFTPEDVSTKNDTVHAHIYNSSLKKWTRKWVPMPKLIYDRCRYQKTYRFQLLKKFRARYAHLTYLNKPILHKWGNQKMLTSNSFIAKHLPDTTRYQKREDLYRFLDKYPLVYLKPEDGTGGRGIVSIRRQSNGMYLLRGRNQIRKIISPQLVRKEQIHLKLASFPLKDGYLIQQGIDITLPNGRVHDFRMLIQKNGQGKWEVTGCAGRVGPPKSVTSNLHGGGSAESMNDLLSHRFNKFEIEEIRSKMETLSHRVVEHVETKFKHLCEMALDLAVDRKGNVWLLEINPKPAREVFYQIGEKGTYKTAIRRPLEYALWLNQSSSKTSTKTNPAYNNIHDDGAESDPDTPENDEQMAFIASLLEQDPQTKRVSQDAQRGQDSQLNTDSDERS